MSASTTTVELYLSTMPNLDIIYRINFSYPVMRKKIGFSNVTQTFSNPLQARHPKEFQGRFPVSAHVALSRTWSEPLSSQAISCYPLDCSNPLVSLVLMMRWVIFLAHVLSADLAVHNECTVKLVSKFWFHRKHQIAAANFSRACDNSYNEAPNNTSNPAFFITHKVALAKARC